MNRSGITTVRSISHPALPGIVIFPMYQTGNDEYDLVIMPPNSRIELHVHEKTDAEMFAIDGEAIVLSADPEANGKPVSRGSVIYFEQDQPHGFQAGAHGFVFASKNRGIRKNVPEAWDYRAVRTL